MKPKLSSRLFLGLTSLNFCLTSFLASGETLTFNTSGTWVCPAGVTSIQVECWGGGGAGGAGTGAGSASSNTTRNGGGGGGGAYARRVSVPVTPGASYTITIPPAAVSGSNGTTTNNSGAVPGGTVTFTNNAGVTVTAAGGGGGLNAYNNVNGTVAGGAGAGGTTAASSGDVTFAGGVGSAGIPQGTGGATNYSGSGGGGAGNAGAGGGASTYVTAAAPTQSAAFSGTAGLVSGGAGGLGRGVGHANSGPGSPGATPGGGGSGAHTQSVTSQLGGTGGLGQIVITTPSLVKADNPDNLNLTTSWVGGVVPISTDIAEWNANATTANTTSLGGDLTLSGILVTNPGGLVTINSGNTLTLGTAQVDLDLSTATQDLTLNCDLAMGAANVWNVASGRTLTLGGVVSGSASVTKHGLGTATLSGASSFTGSTNVNRGTLNITGSITGNPASSKININPTTGSAVVNYNGGTSTLQAVTGATVLGTSSVLNMSGGILNITPGVGTGTQSVSGAGNSLGVGAYGYYNITGGTFRDTTGTPGGARFTMTGKGTAPVVGGPSLGLQTAVVFVGGSNGFIDQTNGEWWLNYSLGQITVADSGKIDRTGSNNPFGLFMDHTSGVTGGGYGVLNLAGTNAQVILGAQPIRFGNSTTAGLGEGQNGFVNVAAGTLSVGANANTSLPAAPTTINNAFFNFAGGTVKATGNLTGWIPVSNASINFNSTIYGAIDNVGTATDFTGGLTVDTNGFAVNMSNPLKLAAGAGVTQANLALSGGSGYVGAPAVIFSSTGVIAGGSPAAGYAVISGGAVTGIVITSPGTYATGTIPTITLIGGGGAGATVTSSALNTANTTGGLTKTGSGTLTLSGANTYTGATNVNSGTLKSSTAGSATTNITVATGAANSVLLATNGGQWINTGDLTLGNSSSVVIDYVGTTPSTTIAPIKVNNLVVGSNLGVRIEGASLTSLAPSTSYPLLTWTNGPADASAFTTILTRGLAGTFTVTGSTLFLNVTSNTAGQPISWNTSDGTWDTVSTNWVDTNLLATTYIDGSDGVLFGDAAGATGNPVITLNGALTPSGVTMNSTSHDYTITGTGSIGGSGGLTLNVANTKTLTLTTANTYTGATTISGGTLQLGDGTTGKDGTISSSSSIINNASLIYNRFGTLSSSVAISGTGTVTKLGAGTQTLASANTYSGATSISEGILKIGNATALGAQTGTTDGTAISAGATLDLAGIATGVSAERLTASGTGVGGNGAIISSAQIASPFIGVRYLTLVGDTTLGFANRWDVGSNTTAGISALVSNGFTLNIIGTAAAAQASFNNLGTTDLGDINVNLGNVAATNILYLQGDTTLGQTTKTVTITGGSTLDIFTSSTVTSFDKKFALDNGILKIDKTGAISLPGTFLLTNANTINASGATVALTSNNVISGTGSLIKAGAGSLTLTGLNTYTGNTTVSAGTLALADNAQLKFVLGATTGVNNSISGAGTVTLGGDFVIDTTAADALTSGTWTLENVSTLTGAYGSTFTVVGFTDAGSEKWTKVNGATLYTFDETTGVLTLASADAYASWATAKGLTGLPGSSTDPAKGADPDGDGRNNLYEFAFDGNPLSGANDGKVVGKIGTVGGNQVMTLTLPVRNTATFTASSGDQVSALIDALYYKIEGDVDLGTFANTISEVTGGAETAIQAGLPALSSGWTYRTFRDSGTVPTVPKVFLRAKISETP